MQFFFILLTLIASSFAQEADVFECPATTDLHSEAEIADTSLRMMLAILKQDQAGYTMDDDTRETIRSRVEKLDWHLPLQAGRLGSCQK